MNTISPHLSSKDIFCKHRAPSLDPVGFFTPDLDGAVLAASVLVEGWQGTKEAHNQKTT